MSFRNLGARVCAAMVCALAFSFGAASAADLVLSPKSTLVIVHESSTPGECATSVSEPCDSYALNVPFTVNKSAQVEAGQDLVSEASAILFGPAGMCADFNSHPPFFQVSLLQSALIPVAPNKFGFSGVTVGFDSSTNSNGTAVQPYASVQLTAKGSGNVLRGGTYNATGSADFQNIYSGPMDIALVPLESDDGDGNDFNCVEIAKPIYRTEIF